MLSRNLIHKNIPMVFSGFVGGPWQLPNHCKWCVLLPKSEATSDHLWLIFKDVSGKCALRQFFNFFLLLYSSPNTMLSRICAGQIFQKFSPDSSEAHKNCQTTTSGVVSSQNHKQLQTTGSLFSKTFRANVPFVSFFFLFFFILHPTPCCPEILAVKL